MPRLYLILNRFTGGERVIVASSPTEACQLLGWLLDDCDITDLGEELT